MDFKDYYVVFGVSEMVLFEDIKKVYWKLVWKYYLDVSKEDMVVDKFKDVGEVYEVFKDLEKWVEYDQFCKYGIWVDGFFQLFLGWQSVLGFGSGGYIDVDICQFSDFFEEIFGGGCGGSGFFGVGFGGGF